MDGTRLLESLKEIARLRMIYAQGRKSDTELYCIGMLFFDGEHSKWGVHMQERQRAINPDADAFELRRMQLHDTPEEAIDNAIRWLKDSMLELVAGKVKLLRSLQEELELLKQQNTLP